MYTYANDGLDCCHYIGFRGFEGVGSGESWGRRVLFVNCRCGNDLTFDSLAQSSGMQRITGLHFLYYVSIPAGPTGESREQLQIFDSFLGDETVYATLTNAATTLIMSLHLPSRRVLGTGMEDFRFLSFANDPID